MWVLLADNEIDWSSKEALWQHIATHGVGDTPGDAALATTYVDELEEYRAYASAQTVHPLEYLRRVPESDPW